MNNICTEDTITSQNTIVLFKELLKLAQDTELENIKISSLCLMLQFLDNFTINTFRLKNRLLSRSSIYNINSFLRIIKKV